MTANEYWLVSDGIGMSIVRDGVAEAAVPLEGIAPPELGIKDRTSVDSLIQLTIDRGFEEKPLR